MSLGDHHSLIIMKSLLLKKVEKLKLLMFFSKEVSEIKHNLNFLEVGQGGLLDIIHQDNTLWIPIQKIEGIQKQVHQLQKHQLNKQELNFKNIFQANPPIDLWLSFWFKISN